MQIHVGTEKYLWNLHKTAFGPKYFMKIIRRWSDGKLTVAFIHVDRM